MQAWPAEESFHVTSVVDGTLYVRQRGVGLMRLERTAAGDSLRLVPGGARFAQTRIYVMLPFDEDAPSGRKRMLLGTREEGLFLYDGARFEPFRTEADALLAEGGLYLPGAVLPNGHFALGTLTAGLLEVDRAGRLIRQIDARAGLPSSTIYYPYEDPSGNLWLATGNGLAQVAIGSPFTRFDVQAGVAGSMNWLTRHEGKLFAGMGSNGVVTLDPATRSLRPVPGPLAQIFSLHSAAGDLLGAATSFGVYRYTGSGSEPVRTSVSGDYYALSLHAWSRAPGVVFVGLDDGLAVLRRGAGGWVDEGRVPGLEAEAWFIAEEPDGALWVGTSDGVLARVRLPAPQGEAGLDLSAAEVTVYGPEDGLMEGILYPIRVGDAIYVTARGETVFRFEAATGRFVEDHTFDGARSGHPLGIYHEAKGRIDFPATKEKGQMLPPYFNRLDDENRLAVWCFKNRKEIVISDFAREHAQYIKVYEPPIAGEDPASVLYLPLVHHDRAIGVITTQSFERDAYTEHHVNLLRSMATYAAIALDNAAAYRQLDATVRKLNITVEDLKTTQQQLVQQEKMASLGALTSGIAHEIKNPLNFVNNFAEVNEELTRELREALEHGDVEDLRGLLDDLASNARQIVKHGKRADSIVRNMMEHAQGGATARYEVNLNKLVDEYVDLSYHGRRAQQPGFMVEIERDYDSEAGHVEVAPQEIGRVLLNLLGNAFDAVEKKAAQRENGYLPRVTVATRRVDGGIEVRVTDNGTGIPEAVRERIFEPFFTTKPTGSGTGLGLSLSYDIVTQGHGGTLSVESEEGRGATFLVSLPTGPSEAGPSL